jgi:hypothetical protein
VLATEALFPCAVVVCAAKDKTGKEEKVVERAADVIEPPPDDVAVKVGGNGADNVFVVLVSILLEVVAEVADQDEPPPELQLGRVGKKARMPAREATPARELRWRQRERGHNSKTILTTRGTWAMTYTNPCDSIAI